MGWLPTFLGFPLGGWLAIETVGSLDGPASAAAGGLLAGAVIGAAQWLALRSHGIGARWIPATSAATAAGATIAAVVTGTGTEVADVVIAGVITGVAHMFGSSGAIVATLLTGIAPRLLLAPPRPAVAVA